MVKYAWYNVGNTSHARMVRDVTRLLRTEDPDILFINEAADRRAESREIDKRLDDYVLYVDASVPGGARIRAFVHDRVKVDKHKAVPLSEKTVVERTVAGGADGTAEAKAMLVIWHRVNGRKRVAAGLHLVPSASVKKHPKARTLHLLQTAKVTAWMVTRVRVAAVGGDWNAVPNSFLMRAARLLIKLIFPKTGTHGDRVIDYAAIPLTQVFRRGAKVLRVYSPEGYASDHDPVIVVFAD